jgi:hypothetical protein
MAQSVPPANSTSPPFQSAFVAMLLLLLLLLLLDVVLAVRCVRACVVVLEWWQVSSACHVWQDHDLSFGR